MYDLSTLHQRVVLAVGAAASLVSAAVVVVGQTVFDRGADAATRLTGSGILLAAAWFIMRWTFKLVRETREHAAEDREAATLREKALLDQLAEERRQSLELTKQLVTERELRLSLERMGYRDRRQNGGDR